ncbi:hypothetical protein LguiA_027925 [Lonicera macranthoides]
MEGEKKRKRASSGDITGVSGRRKKKEMVSPTDAEVDEFFAILRRMHVAVKYFERSNGNDGRRLTERLGLPLEIEVVSPDGDDVKVKEKSVNVGVGGNGIFDLNTVPEGETNSA